MGAIAQLVDNAMHPSVGCRNVWIKFEETPDKDPMLSVQDDGQGLDYPAMNKLLRLYGSFEPGERRRSTSSGWFPGPMGFLCLLFGRSYSVVLPFVTIGVLHWERPAIFVGAGPCRGIRVRLRLQDGLRTYCVELCHNVQNARNYWHRHAVSGTYGPLRRSGNCGTGKVPFVVYCAPTLLCSSPHSRAGWWYLWTGG